MLSANHDAPPRDASYIGFSRFTLYAKDSVTGLFDIKLFELFPSNPYGDTPTPANSILETDADKTLLTIWANVSPTTARDFRAEFV